MNMGLWFRYFSFIPTENLYQLRIQLGFGNPKAICRNAITMINPTFGSKKVGACFQGLTLPINLSFLDKLCNIKRPLGKKS